MSLSFGHTAVGMAVCVLAMIGIAIFYFLLRGLADSRPHYNDGNGFYMFILGVLLPLSFGVILILYHRLLAACREAAKGEYSRSS